MLSVVCSLCERTQLFRLGLSEISKGLLEKVLLQEQVGINSGQGKLSLYISQRGFGLTPPLDAGFNVAVI